MNWVSKARVFCFSKLPAKIRAAIVMEAMKLRLAQALGMEDVDNRLALRNVALQCRFVDSCQATWLRNNIKCLCAIFSIFEITSGNTSGGVRGFTIIGAEKGYGRHSADETASLE